MTGHPHTRAERRAAFDTIRQRYARLRARQASRVYPPSIRDLEHGIRIMASTHGRPCSCFGCRRAHSLKGLFRDLAAEAAYRQDMDELAYAEYEDSFESNFHPWSPEPGALSAIHDAYRRLRAARNNGTSAAADDRNHQALYEAIEASMEGFA